MSKIKHKKQLGVPKQSYVDRLNQKEAEAKERKRAWTHNVYVFTQQETLDIACVALHKAFGFGPARLKRFMEMFKDVFTEDTENHIWDIHVDDENHAYSTEKMEAAIKEAWGDSYEPREKRYECDFILEAPHKPVIDN